ncbi:MAG: hypothetical protein H6882_11715 [Rhodobiaceae bacterium]|nr:hypothetical protein [Rhodobiaceae bacterium]
MSRSITPPPHNNPIPRLPSAEKRPFVEFLIGTTAICSGAMLGMAVPSLIGAGDWLEYAKALSIALAGTVVAFGVNKLAVDKGAPLAALNFKGAMATSLLSISLVGGGMWTATYAGLTIDKVDDLRREAYGTELTHYVSDRNKAALDAAQSGPALRAVVTDLQGKAECEISRSCVSGKGNGGYGTVARILEEKAARAEGISDQFSAGARKREDSLRSLNTLLSRYQEALGKTELSAVERRSALQKIDAEIGQAVGELENALPTGLLTAYAAELKRGVEISGNLTATERLNAILRDHGQALSNILSGDAGKAAERPAFIDKTGVSDTFGYLTKFLPIAAIAFIVEMVLPMTIWLYAYFTLYWWIYRNDPPAPRRVRREIGFGDLLDMPDFYRASDDRHLDLGQAPQPDLPEFRNGKSKPNGRANGWLGE